MDHSDLGPAISVHDATFFSSPFDGFPTWEQNPQQKNKIAFPNFIFSNYWHPIRFFFLRMTINHCTMATHSNFADVG